MLECGWEQGEEGSVGAGGPVGGLEQRPAEVQRRVRGMGTGRVREEGGPELAGAGLPHSVRVAGGTGRDLSVQLEEPNSCRGGGRGGAMGGGCAGRPAPVR